MGDNLNGTYVSQKINKIRWKPELGLDSDTFVTGSWDDEDNSLALWLCPLLPGIEDDDYDLYPRLLCKVSHSGDVTEIIFVTANKFIVSSSSGVVQLFDVVDKSCAGTTYFKGVTKWDNLHYFSTGERSSCTGLAMFEEDIATIGEDGRINLLSLRHGKLLRIIDDADSCSLRCTTFLKHNELLTGNLRGHMKVWDLRNSTNKPVSTFMLSGEQVGASCVTHHPTQRHLVLGGGEDGTVTVWDLRHDTFPVTLLSAHSQADNLHVFCTSLAGDMALQYERHAQTCLMSDSLGHNSFHLVNLKSIEYLVEVTELQFHHDRPEHLFTCSVSGEIWHWNTSSIARSSAVSSVSDFSASAEENPWLSSDAAKHRMEVFALMPTVCQPINSLDINRTRLVCGCDNEAVYLIRNLLL